MIRTFTFILITAMAFSRSGLCAELLLLNDPALTQKPTDSIHFLLGAYTGNDLVPARDFQVEDWPDNYHTRPGNNLGIGHFRIELNSDIGRWRMGYFYRSDWFTRATKDTVDATFLAEKDKLTSLNRTFNLNYTLRGFSADGLRLGYSDFFTPLPGQKVVLGIAASVLHGHDVRHEEVRGELITTSGSGTLSGSRAYYDTRLRAVSAEVADGDFNAFIPPAPMQQKSGWGYGLDFGLNWLTESGASVKLTVNDILAQIKWDRIPYIEQRINNLKDPFKISYSENGAIQGENIYKPFSLKLQPKYGIFGSYPIGDVKLRASFEGVSGFWFPQLGLHYRLSPEYEIGLDYETRFGATTVTLTHPDFYVSLATQNLDFSMSRAVGLSAGIKLDF